MDHPSSAACGAKGSHEQDNFSRSNDFCAHQLLAATALWDVVVRVATARVKPTLFDPNALAVLVQFKNAFVGYYVDAVRVDHFTFTSA